MIAQRGRIERAEMEKTFNMGVGMIAMVAPGSVDTALARLEARGVDAWVLGTARERHEGETGDAAAKGGNGGSVTLHGTHA